MWGGGRYSRGLSFLAAVIVLSTVSTGASGQTSGAVYQSADTAFGPITGSGSCSSALSSETPARTLADALDDAWFASTGSDAISVGLFPTADVGPISNTYTLTFPDVPITVDIGKYDISQTDAVSTASGSFGTIDDAGGTDPTLAIGTSERMQDCSPRPLSLVSTSEGGPLPQPTPFWNAIGFAADRNTLDSVLFSFSQPVDNFGAWFGDLETRAQDATTGPTDGGALAYVKLYAADGTVLAVEPVLPNDQRPVTNDVAPPGDPGFDDDGFGCGDQSANDDFSSCGNHGTRFLGFTWPTNDVAFMQVIVGDDDHCNESSTCSGLLENLSFIGPQIGYENPQVTFTKTVVNNDAGALMPADFALTLIEDPTGAATSTEQRHGDTVELTAGVAYEVTEAATAGYEITSIECTDETIGVLPAVFTVSVNQNITCVIVNDDVTIASTTTAPTTTSIVTTVSTSAPTTLLPPTTIVSTTTPPATIATSTMLTSTTATSTTAASTTTQAVAPSETGPATTAAAVLAITGSTTNRVVSLSWVLLIAGLSLVTVSRRVLQRSKLS